MLIEVFFMRVERRPTRRPMSVSSFFLNRCMSRVKTSFSSSIYDKRAEQVLNPWITRRRQTADNASQQCRGHSGCLYLVHILCRIIEMKDPVRRKKGFHLRSISIRISSNVFQTARTWDCSVGLGTAPLDCSVARNRAEAVLPYFKNAKKIGFPDFAFCIRF